MVFKIKFSISIKEGIAEVNSKGIESRTALHNAVFEKKVEAVQMLLRYGANIESQTIHLRTALHIACILSEDSICQVLLNAGASVDIQDFDQNTPVHYATSNSKLLTIISYNIENIKILKMLFEKRPNLAIKNKKGQTAIDMTNHKFIVSMFVHYLTDKQNEKKNSPRVLEFPTKHINLKGIQEKTKIKNPDLSQGFEQKQKNKIKLLQGPKKYIEVIVYFINRIAF